MNIAFTGSFLRDVRKLPDDAIREQVRNTIETVEAAPDVRSIPNLKKLSGGGPYSGFASATIASAFSSRRS